MRKTVYLDATIPNFIYDRRKEAQVFVKVTNTWWQEERHYVDIWTIYNYSMRGRRHDT